MGTCLDFYTSYFSETWDGLLFDTVQFLC